MIALQGVSRHYDTAGGTPIRALHDVSLSAGEGEWLNIVGPNGSGKSTLLKLVAGELVPTNGRIQFAGDEITGWSQEKRAAMIQYVAADTNSNLVPSMTIEENLIVSRDNNGHPGFSYAYRSSRRRDICAILQEFGLGLEDRIDTQIRRLSSGEKQAVVVAKTFLRKVKALLLDEFTGALDPAMAPRLLDIVRRLAADRNMTVLCVTHDLDLVIRTSARTVMLKNGCIYKTIEANEFFKNDVYALYGREHLEHAVNDKTI